MRTRIHILAFLATCLALPMAWSDEGVLEINQTCAVNDGCFAGDDPGFPVQINNEGSYILTSSVDVTVAVNPPDTTAIAVNIADATIDLNGFAISGPASCSGTPVTTCASAGTGDGISGYAGVLIRNGTVRGMGDTGIRLGSGGEAVNVRVVENGSDGIVAPQGARGSRVQDVLAYRNGLNGIAATSSSTIRDSTAIGNGGAGLLGGDALIKNNVAQLNGSDGVFIQAGAAIDNVASANEGAGLNCLTSAGAARGNVLRSNVADQAGDSCTLVENNICNGSPC